MQDALAVQIGVACRYPEADLYIFAKMFLQVYKLFLDMLPYCIHISAKASRQAAFVVAREGQMFALCWIQRKLCPMTSPRRGNFDAFH